MAEQGGGSFPRIEGYEIEDVIGRGGFATVYRARQPRLDRRVALKVVQVDEFAGPDAVNRFERECRAIGSLSGHPAVVIVFDVGTSLEGMSYLALEYLPGGSLEERVANAGTLPWRDVTQAGVSIASALAAAHDLGILHRDVKPANVLIDAHGNYKLGDFGIAGLASATVTTAKTTATTLAYAPPEVLEGKRATASSDLYSLGATLYALLAGRPAHSVHTDESILPMILRITTDPVPALAPGLGHPALNDLIHDLMAKAPDDRPGSATEVRDALQRVLDTPSGAAAVPTSPPPPIYPSPPRPDAAVPVPPGPPPPLVSVGSPGPPAAPAAAALEATAPVGAALPPGSAPGAPVNQLTDLAPASRRSWWIPIVAVALFAAVAIALIVVRARSDSEPAAETRTGYRTIWTADLEAKPLSVAVVGSRIWTTAFTGPADASEGHLKAISLDGKPMEDVELPSGSGPMVASGSTLWIRTGAHTIIAADGETGKQLSVKTVPDTAGELLVFNDQLWIAGFRTGDLTSYRIGASTLDGSPTRSKVCAKGIQGLAEGFNAVWATCPSDHLVARIDPVTRDVRVVENLGGPLFATAAFGQLWVTDYEGQVLRIDPETMKVVGTTPITGHPVAIAAGSGGVWVTVGSGRGLVALDKSGAPLDGDLGIDETGGVATVDDDAAVVADRTNDRLIRVGLE